MTGAENPDAQSAGDGEGWTWMRAGTNPVYAAVTNGRVEAVVYRSDELAGEDEDGEPIIGEAGWFWFSATEPAAHSQLILGELPDQSETMLIPEHDAALDAAEPLVDQLISRAEADSSQRGIREALRERREGLRSAFRYLAMTALEEAGGAASFSELVLAIPSMSAYEALWFLRDLEQKGLIGSAREAGQMPLDGSVRYYIRSGDVEAEFLFVAEAEAEKEKLDPDAREAVEALTGAIASLALLETVMPILGGGSEPDDVRVARELIGRRASALAQQRGVPPGYEGSG